MSRHGIGWTIALTQTVIGRATNVSNRLPTTAIPTTDHVIRLGVSSRPSITNSPICASHATPSANERVAVRWGSYIIPPTAKPAIKNRHLLPW